jgi:hypothetical protein
MASIFLRNPVATGPRPRSRARTRVTANIWEHSTLSKLSPVALPGLPR